MSHTATRKYTRYQIVILLCILVSSIGIRLFMNTLFPRPFISPDSISYFRTAQNMLKTRVFVDPWRTPTYPLFLVAFPYFSGKPLDLELNDATYTHDIKRIAHTQSVLVIVGLMISTLVFFHLGMPPLLVGVLMIVASANPLLVIWERYILTEPLSVSWLFLFTALAYGALHKRYWIFLGLLVVWGLVGVGLRPQFVLLPLALFVGVAWYHWQTKISIVALLCVLLYILGITGYMRVNAEVYGYAGISRISDVNMMGVIVRYKLPIPDEEKKTALGQLVHNFQTLDGRADPWILMEWNPPLYSPEFGRQMTSFNKNVIHHSLPTYITSSLRLVPDALTEWVDYPHVVEASQHSWVLKGWFALYKGLRYSFLGVLFVVPYAYIRVVQGKEKKKYMMLLIVSSIGLYSVLTAVLFSYGDYSRLSLPSLPMTLLSVLWLIVDVGQKLGSRIQSRVPKHI